MRFNDTWMKVLLTGLLVLAGWQTCMAQRRSNPKFLPYAEVGFGAGTSTYYGALAGYRTVLKSTFTLPRWNLGLMYTRHFTPHLSARASFTYARITGDDYKYAKSDPVKYAAQYIRNLHFRNDLKEFALQGIYQFTADGRNSSNRAEFTPYIFGGLALLAHSPEARDVASADGGLSKEWVKLQPLGTEGQGQPGYAKPYSLVTMAIPVGFGVRYKLNDNFNLAAEIGFRYTLTNYLDDVGGAYPAPNVLTGQAAVFSDRSGELTAARKGGNRQAGINQIISSGQDPAPANRGAGGTFNDSYLLTSFQIHYIIPGKIKCPPIK